jgi:hypothetical protein
VTVRVLRTLSEIDDIRNAWVRWQQHPNSNLDFYSTIVGVRPEIIRPHVIVIYRGEQPDALLVGRLENKYIEFKLGYKTISRIRARSLTFIYQGLLGNDCPENAAIMLAEINKELREHEGDVAMLSSLRTDSPMYNCAKGRTRFRSRPYCEDPRPHWSITLSGSFDEFVQRLAPKTRGKRKQEANRILRDFSGCVKIDCFRKPVEVERMLENAEEIAHKTYHRGLGVGFLASDENRRRFRGEAEKGGLRAYILYLANRPCAFLIGTLQGEVFYGDFMGYDPAYRKYSLGTFLLLRIIEDLCSVGARRFDFGFGDAWYKEHFCDCEWQESSIHVFAPSLVGLTLRMLHICTAVTNEAATSVLKQLHLVLRVKRMWRDLYIRKEQPTTGHSQRGYRTSVHNSG